MKISKARLIEIIKEELSTFEEHFDPDWEGDEEFLEAHRDGDSDGAAGVEPRPPHGFASKYYMRAYKDAFNRTAPARAQKARQRLKLRASDLERQQKLRYKN